MKRTTIMMEEDLLYEVQSLAQEQNRSTAHLIREALALYVVEQRRRAPVVNPLLTLAGLGASAVVTDVANGKDEELLYATRFCGFNNYCPSGTVER